MTAAEPLRQTPDLARRPLSAAVLWGLPIVVGNAVNLLRPALAADALVWAGCLAWMGAGCWLNAQRCSRLHCMLSAPILFVAAGLAGGIALGAAPAWPWALNATIWGAFGLVLLSFAAELVWGRYAGAGPA
ncbi:MAG TPA: hypothetical protein VKT30_03690 [Caulobacteraceae bacterium]|nr:hypothetical protein [Caulobacteraceae bacterium]